jgi:hypothetical protein
MIASRSASSKANLGMTPGPMSIASAIWTSVAWPSPYATLPPPTALPAPVAAWHAAQFAV